MHVTLKKFTLLEMMISVGLLSVLFLALLRTLDIAQRTESMQIRKAILSSEVKRAKSILERDLQATLFRSIDTTQREVNLDTGGTITTWNRVDDFTNLAIVQASFGENFKRCSSVDGANKPNCQWYFREGRVTDSTADDEYRFPNVHSAMQYQCNGNSLTGMTLTKAYATGRVWPGRNTNCPADGAPLVSTGVPIKLVKMLTARDRQGRFRRYMAGPRFGSPDWQGIVFYVNIMEPGSSVGKLLRYVIYKDDLDLEPRSADLGTDVNWQIYDGYEGVLDEEGRPVFPAIKRDDGLGFSSGAFNYNSPLVNGDAILPDSGSPIVGLPTLMNLFDFNLNGDIETFPHEIGTDNFDPLNLSIAPTNLTIWGQEAHKETFRVVLASGEDPKIVWKKEKLPGTPIQPRREFSIEINLRNHHITWDHHFRGSADATIPGSPNINWDRSLPLLPANPGSLVRKPDVVANHVVQWELASFRSTHEFWDPEFIASPLSATTFPDPFTKPSDVKNSNFVLQDRYVRFTLVLDRPYLEGGQTAHEELVFETGYPVR